MVGGASNRVTGRVSTRGVVSRRVVGARTASGTRVGGDFLVGGAQSRRATAGDSAGRGSGRAGATGFAHTRARANVSDGGATAGRASGGD